MSRETSWRQVNGTLPVSATLVGVRLACTPVQRGLDWSDTEAEGKTAQLRRLEVRPPSAGFNLRP